MTMTAFKPDAQEGGILEVSPQNPLPIDDKGSSASVTSQTAETIQLYYLNAGAVTTDAGQAIGVVCFGKTTYDNIKNNLGSHEASFGDTSLTFTSTAFTTEVGASTVGLENMRGLRLSTLIPTIGAFLDNGEYVVLYDKGLIIGKKASTQTTLAGAAYKYNSGSSAGSVAVTSVIPGTGATNLGKAEDAAHTSGDTGVMALAVRNDAGTALAGTTGDYIPLGTDELGNLRVNAGALTDDAAFTPGTSKVTAVGMLADETASDSVDEGDVGAPRMTLDRKQITANQVLDDAAFTPGTSYIGVVGAQADETATDSVDEGDAGALRMTLDRKLYTLSLPDPAPIFDADADNTAQAIKAGAGRLFSLDVINPNPTACYVQLFNTATAGVTVGTTTPVYVVYVPASGSVTKEWPGLFFATAITYACTTTATGSGDPTTGLTLSASYL